VGFEIVGIGSDGFAVGGFGCGGLVEGILGEAEVVEDVGIGGVGFGEGGEELEGGGEVLTVDGGVGFGALWVLRSGLRLLGGVGGASWELGLGKAAGEKYGRKY
jgi:hypothetical protein